MNTIDRQHIRNIREGNSFLFGVATAHASADLQATTVATMTRGVDDGVDYLEKRIAELEADNAELQRVLDSKVDASSPDEAGLGAFAVALRRARVEAGLTKKVLAEKSGVSENTISRAEKGQHKPHAATRKKLINTLTELGAWS